MDIFFEPWYGWVRETRRHCPTTGSAPHPSGVALATGPLLPSRGSNGSIVHKFPGALEAGIPAQRQGWLEAATHAGASAADETPSEATVDRSAETGRTSGGLLHRDVDDPARRRANPPPLGHRVSSGARVENSDFPGLELSKARTPGPSTQSEENPAVEAAGLAAYKKKPGDWARIWFSLMRAGFCSFHRCNALGRRWARHLCCGTVIAGSGSRSLED